MSSDHDLSRRAVLQFVASGTIAMSLTTLAPAAEAASFAITRPIHIRSVSLKVRDLPMMTAFYNQIMGMDILSQTDSESALGKDGQVLLTLKARPSGEPDSGRSAGLFHTAFLMPDRRSLARWLIHAAESRLPLQGASDHLVSEAIYLADPEGNGIEVYADRPRDSWDRNGAEVRMDTVALDLPGLLAAGDAPWRGAPAGTVIGHVHLQVGDVAKAEEFYMDSLGMDRSAHVFGASFFASGGYHHHLAGNIWKSRGAGLRSADVTGLSELVLAADAGVLQALPARDFTDPWGTRITLEAKG